MRPLPPPPSGPRRSRRVQGAARVLGAAARCQARPCAVAGKVGRRGACGNARRGAVRRRCAAQGARGRRGGRGRVSRCDGQRRARGSQGTDPREDPDLPRARFSVIYGLGSASPSFFFCFFSSVYCLSVRECFDTFCGYIVERSTDASECLHLNFIPRSLRPVMMA